MTKQDIAQVCHEVNKAYCEAFGDTSQPSWNEAPDWQKSSALNGVEMHLSDPDASPSQSHDAWLKEKLEQGWRYGPVKNPETKEHPCVVPYEQLTPRDKGKDYIFKQVVASLSRFLDNN